MHSTKGDEKRWRTKWGGPMYFSHGENNARGVAILFERSVNVDLVNLSRDIEGRYILLHVVIDHVHYTLANCYAPNTDTPSFFTSLFEEIGKMKNDNIILAGDFNTVLTDEDSSCRILHPKCTQEIQNWVQLLEMVDIWRVQSPGVKQYTWKRLKPKPIFERLDYFLVSKSLSSNIQQATILVGFKSDHSFPQINCDMGQHERGPGYWKLNVSLLESTEFVEEVSNIINDTIVEHDDIMLRWEMIKMKVRGFAIQFSSRKSRSNKNKIAALTKKIRELEIQQVQNVPLFQEYETQINKVQNDLETLNNKEVEKAIFRLK